VHLNADRLTFSFQYLDLEGAGSTSNVEHGVSNVSRPTPFDEVSGTLPVYGLDDVTDLDASSVRGRAL
jgi:hypothetical protein